MIWYDDGIVIGTVIGMIMMIGYNRYDNGINICNGSSSNNRKISNGNNDSNSNNSNTSNDITTTTTTTPTNQS